MNQRMLILKEKLILKPDPRRVLGQYFYPGSDGRILNIVHRILNLSDAETQNLLKGIRKEFASRHREFEKMVIAHYLKSADLIPENSRLSTDKKILVGTYLSKEYSFESTALMNPSLIEFNHGLKLPGGAIPVLLSLRAVGEGHISSICFRAGFIRKNGAIHIYKTSLLASGPESISFSGIERSPVQIIFNRSTPITERILFPVTPDESNGIEDARWVRFKDENGALKYYASYTAYDGRKITSKLIETSDFERFAVYPLQGSAVQNKGLALFPRKISGRYVMISRLDGENIYIMFSNHLTNWEQADILQVPQWPWEFVQLGNCGSPLLTEAGWLLLIHGVGPFRKYVLSACLMDKTNPSRIVARLRTPLLSTGEDERNGYVPNVVYSCGGMIWHDELILPYAISDYATRWARINLKKLFKKMS